MKVSKETVSTVLASKLGDPSKVTEIMRAIESEEELNKPEKAPTVKKQFVVVVSDPEGKVPNNELTAWIVQIDEDSSPAVALDRVHESAYDFNSSPKGMKMPVTTIGDAMETLTSKFTKEKNLWIKTKTPVLVQTTNNKIPMGN